MKLLILALKFFYPKTQGFPDSRSRSAPVTIRDLPQGVARKWTRNRVLQIARGCLSVRAQAMGGEVAVWSSPIPTGEIYCVGILWPVSGARLAFFIGESWSDVVNKMTAGRVAPKTERGK